MVKNNKDYITKLSRIRTPIIYDTIEKFNVRSRDQGWMDTTIKSILPNLGIMCGYACTGKFIGEIPPVNNERTDPSKFLNILGVPFLRTKFSSIFNGHFSSLIYTFLLLYISYSLFLYFLLFLFYSLLFSSLPSPSLPFASLLFSYLIVPCRILSLLISSKLSSSQSYLALSYLIVSYLASLN